MSGPDFDAAPLPTRTPGPRPAAGRSLAWTFLTVAIGIGAALGFDAAWPGEREADLAGLGDKLAWWREHGAAVDVAVVGSSRVYRSVVPRIVSESLAEQGCGEQRVFNFAWPGSSAPTLLRVLDEIDATPAPSGGRIVLVDPHPAIGPPLHLPGHPRSRYANGWDTAGLGFDQLRAFAIDGGFGAHPVAQALQAVGVEPMRSIRVRLGLDYLRTLAVSLLGIGSWSERFFGAASAPRRSDAAHLVDAGYVSLDANLARATGAARERLLRRRLGPDDDAWLDERRAELRRVAGQPAEPLAAPGRRLVARLLDAAGERGALLLTPTLDERNERKAASIAARFAPEHPVFAVDLATWPALGDTAHWFDRGHMSDAGARAYSARLGERLCAWIRAAGD